MLQPNIPQQGIIPLLIQEKLPAAPQARIDLPMLVEIGSVAPASITSVEVQHVAFADIDEQANRTPAPGRRR